MVKEIKKMSERWCKKKLKAIWWNDCSFNDCLENKAQDSNHLEVERY